MRIGRLLFSLCAVAVLMLSVTIGGCSPASPDATATGSGAPAPAELVKAAHDRDEAVDKADTATWDRLTTPDFTVVDDSGRSMSRAERIAEIKGTKPAASPNPCQQEQFKVYGNAATRRCLDRNAWWLESWVKSDQGWRAAAIQGTAANGGGEGADQDVLKLEQTLNSAYLKKDRATFEELLADDFTSLNSNGTTTNKAQEIAESMDAKWTESKISNLKVRIYGNAAIVTADLTLTGSAKGYVAGPRLRTDIWVRRNGRWQDAVSHTSLVVKR